MDRYGPGLGLRKVFSGHNELYRYGPPPEAATVAVVWTENLPATRSAFASCEQKAVQDNGVGVDNEEQGSVVAVCRDEVGGWAAAWPSFKHFG